LAFQTASPVIIDYLYVRRVSLPPYETDSVLVVDPNAVLPQTVAFQGFQIVASCNREIAQLSRRVQCFQFPPRRALDVPQCWYILLPEKSFGASVAKALDHEKIIARPTLTVKQ
jgi:hypothetical protein